MMLCVEATLLHQLEDAHVLKVQQRATHNRYTRTFDPKVIRTWEAMVKAWEEDPKQPDPYTEPQACKCDGLLVIATETC